MRRRKSEEGLPYDCDKNRNKTTEVVLTANELVVIGNSLRHLARDESACDDLFCNECKGLLEDLLQDVEEELGKLVKGYRK